MHLHAASFAQRISIKANNVSLEQVFGEIKKQTRYDFVYEEALIKRIAPINVNIQNLGLEAALQQILQDKALDYSVTDKIVTIKHQLASKKTDVLPAVQPAITVRGKVTDDKGNPLPGTLIQEKGKGGKAVSEVGGNYMITVPSLEAVLIFSFIGFQSQEIRVGEQRTIDIKMVPAERDLDQVVVIGYGTVAKKDLTGAVGTADIKEMEKAPVVNFDQALAGRVAGVQVSNNDGQPGQEANIVIRGGNSLTQSTAPLYVVDGFPMEDFSSSALSNFDIASISVLKDASATAIYGSRGANGVIVIETKKGQAGKPTVDFSASFGAQRVMKKMDMMSGYEFVKYQSEIYPTLAERYYLDNVGKELEDYRGVKELDLQDRLFRTAPISIYNIALRGGNTSTRYAVSGSLFDQQGVIVNSSNKRYQGRLSLNQTISDKLKAGFVIGMAKNTVDGTPVRTGTSTATSYTLYRTWGFRPVTGTGVDLGDLLVDPESEGLNLMVNPVISLENEVYLNTYSDLNINAFISYEMLKGLTLRVSGGTNSRTNPYKYFYNSQTYRGNPINPSNFRGQYGGIINRSASGWVNENTLTYRKYINKNHVFDIMGGFTMQRRDSDSFGFEADNIPNEELLFSSLGGGTPYRNTSTQTYHTLASFLARGNYTLMTKYMFTASMRADGSSKFIDKNRWGYFPAGAFAWRMKNEEFLKDISVISDAKLRLGYGVTGNNRVRDFDRAPGLVYTDWNAGYSFGNTVPDKGLIMESMGNRSLKWESTVQSNIGLDLGLWEDRLQLTVDLYKKNTKDLLLLANLPRTTGFIREYRNIGEIENKGLEITLNTINIKKKDFSWETNFNIAFNRNKIISLAENESNFLSTVGFDSNFTSSSPYIAMVNYPAALYYGYIWDGNYQYSDFDEVSPGNFVLKPTVTTNGSSADKIQPGDIKYKDINGDMVVDDNDLAVIGNPEPIHIGGINNVFNYKSFSLSAFFQWSYGNDNLNANRLIFEGNGLFRPLLNQYATYENRWTPDNQNNELYRSGGHGPFGAYSSRVIEDGSYIRLKTLSFSYTLPESLSAKVYASNLAVTFSGQNLITWTNYSGLDPEVSTRHSALTPGFDYSPYPMARTFVFGITAKF
ncbi:TonB-dependent receptor [Sphingobacterium sp. SGG-5]|nr:TonB-dependent receptor [Sphingobacterium sp. SGG-5]